MWTKSSEDELGIWLKDDIEFFCQIYEPSKPKATLLFVHGLGEHIQRYTHVFNEFKKAGIRVFAFDQRGFGRTVIKNQGTLGDLPIDRALSDINSAVEYIEKHYPGNLFIMGHSMGGLLVTLYMERYVRNVKGLIISAPAYRPAFYVPPVKRIVGSFLANFIGSFNIPSELEIKNLSRDEQVAEKYKKDPLVHDKGSLQLMAGLLREGQRCIDGEFGGLPDVPVLFTHGTADKITLFDSTKEFYEKLDSDKKKFIEYDGFYHELHNEPEKAQVIKAYIEWILKQ